MKAAIIYNPCAGRAHHKTGAQVQDCLARHGFTTVTYTTTAPGEATTIAASVVHNSDVVVAVGGDGTVNEVINGMGSSEARLGIVPAGTVNVLALELGLPFQVERACAVIARGHTLALDVGQANGRRFVLMMGAGIDALTIRNLDPELKTRFRRLAFVSTGLRTGLAKPPTPFLVQAQGHEYRATFFVAGNSRYYGGRFGLTSEADPTDGLLDLLIFQGTTIASLAGFWLGAPTGLHLHHPDLVYMRGEKAEVLPLDDKQPVWFQTDGELAGTLPAIVSIDYHALRVLVPEKQRGR